MFKDILVTRSTDRDRRLEHQDYIADGHSSLVMSMPAFQGVFQRFSMNRALLVQDGVTASGLYTRDPDALVVVEHVCASRNAFATASSDPQYLAAVKPDEDYIGQVILSGPPTAYDVQETTVFDGPAHRLRVFDFLSRCDDVSVQDFADALSAEGEQLARDSAYRSVVGKRVHNTVGTTPSLYAISGRDHDGIVETWVEDFSALEPHYERLRARQAPYVDPAASFSVFTVQSTVV